MLPIEDHAVIGDCHGSALIGRDGSVAWCAFERFDAEPALFGLLDTGQGGAFVIEPAEPGWRVERGYLRGTNVLETIFICADGRFSVTDFMPVGRRPGAGVHDYVDLLAPHALVRRVGGIEGRVAVRATWRSAGGFKVPGAQTDARALKPPGGDLPWQPAADGPGCVARFTLERGQSRFASLSPHCDHDAEQCRRLHDITIAFWREWIGYCRYHGPYGAIVERSALLLKLLTYAPTGAIVAAPTTSLPESIGSGRNWDYRYCWIRDACFTLYALAMLGYSGEAMRFGAFMERITTQGEDLQIMYAIDGSATLTESELDHLSGYRDSRPVRVGNGAHGQRQTDVYGEFADWALLNRALGGKAGRADTTELEAVAALALRHADEPEHGIWEMRGAPRHHVLGKVMCWVTLDRATRLIGKRPEWSAKMDELRQQITERGVVDGALAQSYGAPARDAALLLIPLLDFPLERDLLARTVDAIDAELGDGDLLQRYRNQGAGDGAADSDSDSGDGGDGSGNDAEGDSSDSSASDDSDSDSSGSDSSGDGLEGDEGAFLACSFWHVDALLAVGRQTEARRLFERLIARANDVGLFAEEIDPRSGAFLGNFPQALSHLALVLNAVHLDLVDQRGTEALRGTLADRAQRSVGATQGWRALWCAFKDSRRVGRIVSSQASMMAPDLL